MINWKKARGTMPHAFETLCAEIGCELLPAYNKLYKDVQDGIGIDEVTDDDLFNYLDRKDLICCISIRDKNEWQFVIADHTGQIVLLDPTLFEVCTDRKSTNETAIKAALMIFNDRIIQLNDAKSKSDQGE